MASNEMPSSSSSSSVRTIVEYVEDNYALKELIGVGATSKVYLGEHRQTQNLFAIKCISAKYLEKHSRCLNLKNEINALQKLKHPNIVRMIEIFDNPTQVCLVMELVTGGELYDRIIRKKQYAEKDASCVIYQILDAVAYLHDAGIVHRDIKLENILYETPDDDSKVMLTDFGLSSIGVVGKTLTKNCGTPEYMALEMVEEKPYGKEVDVWAIGVLTYILLFGDSPFYEWEDAEDFRNILALKFRYNSSEWDDISDAAKDFMRKLLDQDPKKRYTCRQAMTDPWICGGAASTKNIQEFVSTNMKLLRKKCKQVVDASNAVASTMCKMAFESSAGSP